MRLSICIPTYNRPNQLPNCLESIYIAQRKSNFKVNVCISDNNSNYKNYDTQKVRNIF